jgi:biopolymer transport protein TolR
MEGESYRLRKKKLMSDINVVPYIDVMLVLLIIFMITAPLLKQGVDVQLPQAKSRTVDTKDQENLVVTVDRQGRYFLDDRELSADALGKKASAMIALRPQIQVLVRGDRDVPYGKVVQAMVLLQTAGAKSVGLLTEPPQKTR